MKDLVRLTDRNVKNNRIRGIVLNELMKCNDAYNSNRTINQIKELSILYCEAIGNYAEKTIEMAFSEYRLISEFHPTPASIRKHCNTIANRLPSVDCDHVAMIPQQTTISETEYQENMASISDTLARLTKQLDPNRKRMPRKDRPKNRK